MAKFVILPIEPTREILEAIARSTFDDLEIGKTAQLNGSDIPPNAEMEMAYGQYKRMVEPWILKSQREDST